MAMPLDFKYKNVLQRGRPRHDKYDNFYRKHPPMDTVRWAKIFAPFDALDGFDEAVNSKLVLYEERRDLSECEMEQLNQVLSALRSLTYNSRVARTHRPQVSITYFSPCTDRHSEWYGRGGIYRTITGTVRRVDRDRICLTDTDIPLDDIIEINERNPQ
jgi:hypothetical protein